MPVKSGTIFCHSKHFIIWAHLNVQISVSSLSIHHNPQSSQSFVCLLFTWFLPHGIAPAIWKDFSSPFSSVSSVTQSCLTLCDLMDCITPVFPVLHYLPESVMLSNRLILCHPLLLLPSIFPSIRVFSNESVLRIRLPKYWSFSFSISPSNEYSGLISFRIDWFDLFAVQGTLKSLLQHPSSKTSIL